MDIPVYLIAGFLDAGKTNFINGILKDGFAAEDKTLLICCEEGEEEYDPHGLFNVFTYTVEDQAELTPELFKKLEKQYRPKQVIIEYNGMWMMEPLYRDALPEIKRADVQPSDIPIQAKAEKRPWSAGRLAAAIALFAGILAALWVIAGLLMDMGFLPYIDMGYSWFNMNIAPWF